MVKARDDSPTRRLVRSKLAGDFVAELHPFYLLVRPYRSRTHKALVTISWGRLYDQLLAEKAQLERAKRGRRK